MSKLTTTELKALSVSTVLQDHKLIQNIAKQCLKAEATIEQVRDECLKHVKLTKSPVLVLDTIGWILGGK